MHAPTAARSVPVLRVQLPEAAAQQYAVAHAAVGASTPSIGADFSGCM